MKATYLKRAVGLALAAAISTSLIAGCSSNKTGSNNSGAKTDETPVTGLPIVTTPITLKYWGDIHVQATQFIRSYSENEVYQETEKRTGIKIEFIHPATGQAVEQFNLMIAAGDLPDIIQGAARYKGGIAKGVEDGVYYDATKDLPRYAPDYYKLINSDPEIKRGVSWENGLTPAFYRIKPESDPPWRRLIARKDWLAELGVQVPKTFDEWEGYLKGIKEKKGIQNPYVLKQDGIDEVLMGAFNIMPEFYLKDGKTVEFGKMQAVFKDYLTLMNKWYTFGYIAKDFPTTKEPQAQALFTSGRAGAVVASVDSMFNETRVAKIDMTPAPFPRIKEADKLHWKGKDFPVTAEETVVTADCKYKTEAIRWLNYPYSKEGSLLFNYGIEGKSYVMENGVPKYTDYMLKNPKYTLPPANYILRTHFAPKLTESDLKANPSVIGDPAGIENRKMWADDKNIDGQLVLPPLKLTLDESTKRAQIMSEVNSYTAEMILKFIIGSEPLTKFDEYVKHIKDLGIAEAINITQQAYDRHMKN